MRGTAEILRRVLLVATAFTAASLFLMPMVAGADQVSLERALSDPAARGCAVRNLLPIQKHDAPVTVTASESFVNVSGQTEAQITYDIFNRVISSVSEWDGYTVRSVHEYSYTCPYDFLQSLRRESWELLQGDEVIGSQETVYEDGVSVSATHNGELVPILTFRSSEPAPTRECDRTSLPLQVRDAPVTHAEEDGKQRVVITFDMYDRVTSIIQQMPLGYTAETSYEYFDETYLDEEYSSPGFCSYFERKRGESGRLLKNGEVRADYHITFNTDEDIIEQVNNGGRFVRFVLAVLAPILGYSTDDPESREWIEERFGDA